MTAKPQQVEIGLATDEFIRTDAFIGAGAVSRWDAHRVRVDEGDGRDAQDERDAWAAERRPT